MYFVLKGAYCYDFSSSTDAFSITTNMLLGAMIWAACVLKEPVTGKKVFACIE